MIYIMDTLAVTNTVDTKPMPHGGPIFTEPTPTKRQKLVPSSTSITYSVQDLNNEIQCWKQEIAVLLQLIHRMNRSFLPKNEQVALVLIAEKLAHFSAEKIPQHQSLIDQLQATQLKGKQVGNTLSQSHFNLRESLMKLKLAVLPLLPQMVPVTIW